MTTPRYLLLMCKSSGSEGQFTHYERLVYLARFVLLEHEARKFCSVEITCASVEAAVIEPRQFVPFEACPDFALGKLVHRAGKRSITGGVGRALRR